MFQSKLFQGKRFDQLCNLGNHNIQNKILARNKFRNNNGKIEETFYKPNLLLYHYNILTTICNITLLINLFIHSKCNNVKTEMQYNLFSILLNQFAGTYFYYFINYSLKLKRNGTINNVEQLFSFLQDVILAFIILYTSINICNYINKKQFNNHNLTIAIIVCSELLWMESTLTHIIALLSKMKKLC